MNSSALINIACYLIGLFVGYYLWNEKHKCVHCGHTKTDICLHCYEELLVENTQLLTEKTKLMKGEPECKN